jgi:hypothetical protein
MEGEKAEARGTVARLDRVLGEMRGRAEGMDLGRAVPGGLRDAGGKVMTEARRRPALVVAGGAVLLLVLRRALRKGRGA